MVYDDTLHASEVEHTVNLKPTRDAERAQKAAASQSVADLFNAAGAMLRAGNVDGCTDMIDAATNIFDRELISPRLLAVALS